MQIYLHLCTVQMAQIIWTIFHFLNQDLEMLQNADCNRFQINTLGECVKNCLNVWIAHVFSKEVNKSNE